MEELSAEERRDLKNDIRLLIRKQCLVVSSRKDDFIHRLSVISCPLSVVRYRFVSYQLSVRFPNLPKFPKFLTFPILPILKEIISAD